MLFSREGRNVFQTTFSTWEDRRALFSLVSENPSNQFLGRTFTTCSEDGCRGIGCDSVNRGYLDDSFDPLYLHLTFKPFVIPVNLSSFSLEILDKQ